MTKDINRSVRYNQAKVEATAALDKYCYASIALDMAHIRERHAEICSQSFSSVAQGAIHERLGEITDREREIGLAFARYAVFGRCDED